MEFYNKHPDNSKGVWTFALQTIWTTDVWATWVGRLDHMPEYNNMQQKLFCGRKQLANSKFPKADLYPHPLRQANHSVKSANYASFMLDVYFKNITASYDTIWYITLTRAQKLTNSQLNMPYGTKQKSNEETKNKNQDAQKKRSSHKVCGVSPEAGFTQFTLLCLSVVNVCIFHGWRFYVLMPMTHVPDIGAWSRCQKTGISFWNICHAIWCRIFLTPDSGVE